MLSENVERLVVLIVKVRQDLDKKKIRNVMEWGRGEGGNRRERCFTYCRRVIVAGSHLPMRPSALLSFAIGRSLATPFILKMFSVGVLVEHDFVSSVADKEYK